MIWVIKCSCQPACLYYYAAGSNDFILSQRRATRFNNRQDAVEARELCLEPSKVVRLVPKKAVKR